MIRNIELAIVAQRHFSESEAKDYLQITNKQIQTLNQILQLETHHL